ncbi:MAG: hypothetical protein J07HN6_01627, partial [Halonotius sp. J07HN6]
NEFERVVESETDQSVSYSNPMENSVSVVYINNKQVVPHFIREAHPAERIIILFTPILLYIVFREVD